MEKKQAFTTDENGRLVVGGVDCVSLAERYGTPLIAYDEELIRERMRVFRDVLREEYGDKGKILYSLKAFSCLAMCALAKQEGLGAEVSTGGELYTAIKAGIQPEEICFVGNNKSKSEIEYALDCGVGCVVVDAYTEIEAIDSLAQKRGVVQDILLRINPLAEGISSADPSDCRFGFSVADGTANMMTALALGRKNVALKGYHCHIGTQIKSKKAFLSAAEVCTKFLADMKNKNAYQAERLDLGGGFPAWYTDEDEYIGTEGYREWLTDILRVVKEGCEAQGIDRPQLIFEPGRSIVAEAGTTLYRVGAIKNIPGVRKYICVDGGMTENPVRNFGNIRYTPVLANRAAEKNAEVVTIAGKSSDENDLIAGNVSLPKAEAGDILAILSTGAYEYSMATNYGRTPLPAVVLAKDGKEELIVRRQTYEDVLRFDALPDSFR